MLDSSTLREDASADKALEASVVCGRPAPAVVLAVTSDSAEETPFESSEAMDDTRLLTPPRSPPLVVFADGVAVGIPRVGEVPVAAY